MSDEYVTDYDVEPDTFPADLLVAERWFVWKLDQGRKIPRAPWSDEHSEETYASWKNEAIWTDFEIVDEWVAKLNGYGHASCIPDYGDNSEPRLIFFDFDDVRDPETGAIHHHAWEFIQTQGLHAAISTSGTGVHGFGYGRLPEDYKPSFERELPDWEYTDDPELEVYAESRFMALTGDHIAGTPVGVPELGETSEELFLRYGEERSTGVEREPDISREELADIETTTDMEDIYDAIAQTRPRDIRLQSSKTGERADGTVNLDPSWANSESGTRLAQFEDHWLYRKGNHNLDALQVVALEERIISDESAYPSGADFWNAVDALRDRGAHIPEYESAEPELDIVKQSRDDDSETVNLQSDDQDADVLVNNAEPQPAETDGGAAAVDGNDTDILDPFEQFAEDVRRSIREQSDDRITAKTCRHQIAHAFTDHYDFVYPEEEVRGWRSVLYVYEPEEGIYEPRGGEFIRQQLEKAAADYTTNQVVNEITRKVERMTIDRGEQFGPDPHKMVVANGILNLHTGELDNWSPLEYHRTKLDVRWNPDAGEPTAIDEFLHEIVDDSDVPTLYRLVAHTIYKEYVAEKAAILIGSGQNGKSVFLDLVEKFLGQYNVVHRELQDFDDDDFAANNLEGKLANLATEIGEQELRNTTTFKKLTGRDTMDAAVKFEKPITFENYATLMFATNEMPVFGQDNHAIWRRWVYVDFPNKFDANDPTAKDPEPKRQLMQRLTDDAELESILWRCQQEIQRWHDEGEDWFADAMPPEEVRDKMKKAAEPVYNFASTCLDVGDEEDTYVQKSTVRAAYRAYADAEDLPTIPENRFGEELVSLRDFPIEPGQRRVDGSRMRVYNGIELSSRGRQVLGIDGPEDDDQQQVNDGRQAKVVVMDELRQMVDANDGKPVPRSGVVWRCTGEITTNTARNALDKLITETDRVMETDDDHVIPTDL